MKWRVSGLLLGALTVLPLIADDGYRFHVSMSTLAGGLRAIDPNHQALSSSPPDRLAEPAMLFQKPAGKSGWRATFITCPKSKPQCEVRITSRTSGGSDRESDPPPLEQRRFDLGFSYNLDGTVRTRCFRESCAIRYARPGEKESELLLGFGECKNLPLDIDIDVAFP